MAKLLPDQSFYPSAKMAMEAAPEKLAYVALLNPTLNDGTDAMAVVDLDPASKTYGSVVSRVDMPNAGDELHHFGWNACSSCLCPHSPHPHMERRFLVVPGMRSSRIHVLDTKADPRNPKIVKVIEPEEVKKKTGYSRPHTAHCGPDGVYLNALGSVDGQGPGGIFMLDPEILDVKGAWEADRGPQYLAYDFWWHLGHDTMITSEWGTPSMVEDGVNPELLLGGKYGHALHRWDLHKRRHQQTMDLGPEYQMVLELRPSHDPNKTYGFVGVVTSLKDLSSSIWVWYREGSNGNGTWKIRKVIEIPAEAADPEKLPPLLKGFKAVSAIGDGYQSFSGRPLPVCLVLGKRGTAAIRCIGSFQASVDWNGDFGRPGKAAGSPEKSGEGFKWRAADGRNQPRWQARVCHQLALPDVG
jgi:selenium-binding protein 1